MSSIIKVDQIQLANGSTPTAGDLGLNITGAVLQIVSQNLTTGYISTTSSTPVSTGHSATITPSSASSKILVIVSCSGFNTSAGRSYKLRLERNGTQIQGHNLGDSSTGTLAMSNSIVHLDSPATTNAVTYEMFYDTDGDGTAYYNYNNAFGGDTITLVEIAG